MLIELAINIKYTSLILLSEFMALICIFSEKSLINISGGKFTTFLDNDMSIAIYVIHVLCRYLVMRYMGNYDMLCKGIIYIVCVLISAGIISLLVSRIHWHIIE